MKNLDSNLWGLILAVAVGTASLIFVVMGTSGLLHNVFQSGYEQGQMDGLKGKWRYEVVIKPDTLYIAKPQ